MFWQAIEAVFIIFLMIAAGVFVAWRGWVTQEAAKVFPKLVVNVALPALIIHSFSKNFTQQSLLDSWLPILIIFTIVPISFLIGQAAARLFRVPKQRRGVFSALFSFSNSVFIGFPVAQALFGDEGMPYAVFYYLANTTFFWVLGYLAIRHDADRIKGIHSRITAKDILSKLLTPPIITIFTMAAVVLLGIRLPFVITETAKYIGGMTSRFLLIPAFCFGVCTLAVSLIGGVELSELSVMRDVFTVQIGLPVMTSVVIVAELYGADAQYATKNVIWTTLASLLTIPAYMILFQYI